jgi:membrane protein
MRKHVRTFSHILFVASKRFLDEQFFYRASALAFTTLLALVPLLFVVFFFMTTFPIFSDAFLAGENYIYQHFLPNAASSIIGYLQNFMHQAARLPTLSIIFLFITTLLLVDTIEETLNNIWHAPYRKGLNRIIVLFTFWIIFLLIPLILGLGVFLSSYLLNFIDPSNVFISFVLYFVPLIVNIIFLTLTYTLIPNVKINWTDGLIGGIIAGIIFEIAKILFAFYLINFPSYSLIYGSFAILPIFLIWLYIFWAIIIYGALLSYANHHYD